MVNELINILEPLGYDIFKQGSLLPDQPYPDTFFTFWNNAADGSAHYDNKETAVSWSYDLNVYSSDPQLVNTVLLQAKELLTDNNWVVSGKGHDVLSDEVTHTGRGITILYRE